MTEGMQWDPERARTRWLLSPSDFQPQGRGKPGGPGPEALGWVFTVALGNNETQRYTQSRDAGWAGWRVLGFFFPHS